MSSEVIYGARCKRCGYGLHVCSPPKSSASPQGASQEAAPIAEEAMTLPPTLMREVAPCRRCRLLVAIEHMATCQPDDASWSDWICASCLRLATASPGPLNPSVPVQGAAQEAAPMQSSVQAGTEPLCMHGYYATRCPRCLEEAAP